MSFAGWSALVSGVGLTIMTLLWRKVKAQRDEARGALQPLQIALSESEGERQKERLSHARAISNIKKRTDSCRENFEEIVKAGVEGGKEAVVAAVRDDFDSLWDDGVQSTEETNPGHH